MGVMKSGKAANSHDTIQWATVYSRWCFRNKGSARYTNNICDIFDILAQLNATRLNAQKVQTVIKPRLISALVERCGLLPPSECMLTLHEVIHVCDQVIEVGAPRVSTLYKFERMNHVLKEMLQNSAKGLVLRTFYLILRTFYLTSFYVHFTSFYAHFTSFYAHYFLLGLASILKNFLQHELITMHMTLHMTNVDKLTMMSNYQPTNIRERNMDTILKGVFVDNAPHHREEPIIYEIGSAGITELHGTATWYDISVPHFSGLLLSAADDVEDDRSLLAILRKKYRNHTIRHPRRFKNDFAGYIFQIFEESMVEITHNRTADAVYMDDITQLQSIISTVLEVGRYSVQ